MGLTQIYVMPIDAIVFRPFQDCPTGELGAVVRDDAGWFALEPDKYIQIPHDASTQDAGISDQAQVLAATDIVHTQDAEPGRCSECVGKEVQ